MEQLLEQQQLFYFGVSERYEFEKLTYFKIFFFSSKSIRVNRVFLWITSLILQIL